MDQWQYAVVLTEKDSDVRPHDGVLTEIDSDENFGIGKDGHKNLMVFLLEKDSEVNKIQKL